MPPLSRPIITRLSLGKGKEPASEPSARRAVKRILCPATAAGGAAATAGAEPPNKLKPQPAQKRLVPVFRCAHCGHVTPPAAAGAAGAAAAGAAAAAGGAASGRSVMLGALTPCGGVSARKGLGLASRESSAPQPKQNL